MAKKITPEYRFLRTRWNGMHERCNPKRERTAKNYPERGITVCPEWSDFDAFMAYVMKEVGLPDLQSGVRWNLDRKDNSRGYEPGNIRWVTYQENLRNRRNNRVVEFRGEKMLMVELAERTGLAYGLLHDRILRHGWDVEKAATTPILPKSACTVEKSWRHEIQVTHNGKTQSLRAWAKELGFDRASVAVRLKRGWSFEAAIAEPPDKGRAPREKAERFEYEGEMLTLSELEARTGIKRATLRYRLQILRLPLDEGTLSSRRLRQSKD
jgi:hypothetical protein